MKHELTPRQNEIVDVALHLIAEGGIGNLTIRHISNRLNLTEAALYAHFSGKLEIIQALVSRFEGKADELDESLRGWAAVGNSGHSRTI